jgi:hypothetical protein
MDEETEEMDKRKRFVKRCKQTDGQVETEKMADNQDG